VIGNSTKWADSPQDDGPGENPNGSTDDNLSSEGALLRKFRRLDGQGTCSSKGDHMNYACAVTVSKHSNPDTEINAPSPAQKKGTQLWAQGDVRLTGVGRMCRRCDREGKHTEEEYERYDDT